jgi:plastocyanin
MNKIVALIAIAVVVVAGWLMFRDAGVDTGLENLAPQTNDESQNAEITADNVSVKEFTVTGTTFAFNPKTITVNRGDTVKINFVNSVGMHDWVIDEFNARTPVIQVGQSATVTFVADKSGSFEYYCSVGNHRQMGMVGTLVVR